MDLKLNGKTAIVTGATGGIGLEIARALSLEGAKVTLPGRTRDRIDAAIANIAASGGETVTGALADPTTEDGVSALTAALPQVDILVNNLGIYEIKPFQAISDDEWRRYFEINVLGGIRLSRAYMPGMLARNWGRIIFISSESGLMTPGGMVHYGMTKTAQLAVARGLASEAKGTGVTVNSVLPGPTRSDGIVDFLRSLSSNPDASAAEVEAEFFEKHRPTSLLQRLIEPQEIANLVAYVSSPLSSATNGAALRVDGGVVPTIA
ncbi:MAG: SDR family NAD(P)-dependent oxidoreductase [Ancalomicrobiaceae bacterium]|nr:SDR family NAD(P)-dependent oxidoreductase [Ancalomicrobiaceae bacterium]